MQPLLDHLRRMTRRRDFYAGGLMLLLGLGIALKGLTYPIGTLTNMRSGFLPTTLGVILAVVGIAIAASSLSEKDGEEDQRILPENPQWWGWFCILAGPVLFVVCGRYFGMLPGTFACVFVAALGDRTATWKSSLILAAIVSAFGVGLFSYILKVPMPVLHWGIGT